MNIGTQVRLNAKGLKVDAGYDWSEDVLRPGVVGAVCGFENGWVFINAGGDSQYYDEVFLEHADVGDSAGSEGEIQVVEDVVSESAQPPGLILVVGECGDGKHFLINKLRDQREAARQHQP